MSWNALFGVACIISFCLPLAIIIYNRFYTHKSLAALFVYYTLALADNIMAQQIIFVPQNFTRTFEIVNNYLDVPLMLMTLLYFCPNKQKQNVVNIIAGMFLAYEIVIAFVFGLTVKAIIYIMGPGLIVILLYAFYLFIRQVKFSIMNGKNVGRTLMLASIFFAYGSYTLIYFFYYILRTPYKSDTLLLYFISSMVASVLMAIGLHMMRKRMKELRDIRITRRELASFFGEPQKNLKI
jgi:hypothetical protein